MEYKSTLNLPKTDFPMKANLAQMEPRMLSAWETKNVYRLLRDNRKGAKKYVLHDGPPYANGVIHIGHALNKILKDILIKYEFLKGNDAPFIIGWDCHGLPVEHALFKELKKNKHDIDIVEFRKNAKDFALKFMDLQRQDFKRLGIFCDWDNPYLTLNKEYEWSMIGLLEKLNKQGYIFRGRKPVNWCAACETALAEAEVEYADKESDSIYFLFEIADDINQLGISGASFLVWTTTPWTLVSNTAVAVHPKFNYCLAEYDDKKIILCSDRVMSLEKKFNKDIKVIKEFTGRQLEGIILQHPFINRRAKVLAADFISKDDGSGCVHIAPGHGAEDFSLTRIYPDLPIIMPVNEKGRFIEPPEFAGKSVPEANEQVLNILRAGNSLIKHEKITHSYPHCWRCKRPIIFRATHQWFLSIDHDNLRDRLIKSIDTAQWVPAAGKERMRSMIETRPDWCLSRQRLWGVPIPALKCVSCGEVFLDNTVVNTAADIFRQEGSDAWFVRDVKDFVSGGVVCPKCGKNTFSKEFDILDVWFESGASFSAVVKNNSDLRFPADMYLEGSDQHRGWFQVSLIPSIAVENKAPFKTILTHGFVVDSEGRKMSKSLGNVISPQDIIKRYGAEILRLWAAYSDYSDDVKISDDLLKQLSDIYRKVRNTMRFVLSNLYDYDYRLPAIKYEDLLEVDKYMLARLANLHEEVTSAYNEYEFYKVCQKIFNFCNLDLSSFYLDISKDRLYTFSPKSRDRQSCQFVLSEILFELIQLIAPIMPFTAEEAYEYRGEQPNKRESVFITVLGEQIKPQWRDNDLISRWERFLRLRQEVLKAMESWRSHGGLGSSLEAKITLILPQQDYEICVSRLNVLREIFIVSQVAVEQGAFEIKVAKADGQKCQRCWNFNIETNFDIRFPEICPRCVSALLDR